MDDWRPISEAPDEEDYEFQIVWNGSVVCVASLHCDEWIDGYYDLLDPQPTHWMPLPAPPSNAQEMSDETSDCEIRGRLWYA